MKAPKDLYRLDQWYEGFGQGLMVIAGPCSAETRQQVLQAAREISVFRQVKALRAGIWKPRTRPDSFQGVGEKALAWLQEARAETGLRMAVEVATPAHVEMALKYEMDMVWLGARTTSNPFSLQQLTASLRASQVPVLIKNPVNPDIQLWIGALERLYQAGLRKLAAVHRGFYPYEPTSYRNLPQWEMLIELKRQWPELPIICDPSHIAGESSYVGEIAQQSLDLNADGLMIEAHPNPPEALSDPRQQLTPAQLGQLLDALKKRDPSSANPHFNSNLENLREQIDAIDHRMLDILARRMKTVRQIGRYKKQNQVSILQMNRWQDILTNRLARGQKLGLDQEFLKKLLELIHKESIHQQRQVINQDKTDS